MRRGTESRAISTPAWPSVASVQCVHVCGSRSSMGLKAAAVTTTEERWEWGAFQRATDLLATGLPGRSQPVAPPPSQPHQWLVGALSTPQLWRLTLPSLTANYLHMCIQLTPVSEVLGGAPVSSALLGSLTRTLCITDKRQSDRRKAEPFYLRLFFTGQRSLPRKEVKTQKSGLT